MKDAIESLKLFGIFTCAHLIFSNINLYQAKYIQPTIKELAKYNFYLLVVYWILNIGITIAFSVGINNYKLPVWVTTIIYWGAGVIPTLIAGYFWFGQLPTLKQLTGLSLVLFGVILVNIK